MTRALLVALVFGLLIGTLPRPAGADRAGAEGLELVAGFPYRDGTHLAFTSSRGRDYAFAVQAAVGGGTGSLRAIDVTDPRRPVLADVLECGFNQGYLDVSFDRRTLLMGADVTGHAGDECLGAGQMGFMTIDISDPESLRPLGFAPVDRGSHGATAHPRRPLVYNSYGDVVTGEPAEFEIWSIRNPAEPRRLGIVPVPGYHGPHDMTFSPDGTLMVASNVTTLQVFDTRDPADPRLLTTTQCPGCQHTHESRFTPDGRHLVVTDETLTSLYTCPGGGLYFYDVGDGGSLSFTGAFEPTHAGFAEGRAGPSFCTAHVIGLSRDGTKVAASWHGAGVRYIDISFTDGVSLGDDASTGRGPRELGWFTADNSDAMSAKLWRGPYLYSNDVNRGFEVFRILD